VTAGKQLQQQQVKLFNCELAWAKKLKSGKQAENVAAVKTLAEKEVFFSLAKFHISLSLTPSRIHISFHIRLLNPESFALSVKFFGMESVAANLLLQLICMKYK